MYVFATEMRRWLRRLAVISSAAVLLGLAGCATAPSASHAPGTTSSPSAPATPTPPATTASGTPPAAPSPAATPVPTPVATPTPAPAPAPTPAPTATPPFPWPSGPPTVGPGQVEFALLVVGTPAPGEELSLSFQAPGAGQNEFQLCGGPNPCRQEPGQVYTWGSRNLPAGASPWAFQESLNGTTTTISSGTVDAAQGAVVTAITQS